MKVIYTLFVLAACGLVFINSSSGPANVQGQDRTGGPLANGFCGNCHGAGAFNPMLDVALLENDQEVGIYLPGQTYTLQVTINADADALRYGFQAVALDEDNNQVGSFAAGTGTQVVTLAQRQYVEHSSPSTSNTFEVEWTAPSEANLADVRFFVSGIAANNNGSSGGDGAVFLNEPVVVERPVGTRELPALAHDLLVFPNPVNDLAHIQLSMDAATTVQLRLFNQAGRLQYQGRENLQAGSNHLELAADQLPAGTYWLELSDGTRASRTAVVKQ